MKDKIQNILTSVVQDFFKIRMTEAFGPNWCSEVAKKVMPKFDPDHPNPYQHNYLSAYNVLMNEGVENLNERRMDITTTASLIQFDFFPQCKVGSKLKTHIINVRDIKNELVSHLSDLKDVLSVQIMELTALKTLRAFLTYLSNCTWSGPGKQEFLDQYTAQLEDLQAQLIQGTAGDLETLDLESSRRVYLERLAGERAEHAEEYVPLSYKVDDNTSQRYNLDELFDLPENRKGFVLFSKEAGCGKTWSVQELAGRCAKEALAEVKQSKAEGEASTEAEEHKPTPVLIRMGELAAHEEPIVKAVQDTLYPEDTTLDRARKLLNQEPVVLFIDGMDEAKQENRDSARRELLRLRSSAKQLRIIGGTRESDLSCYPAELKRYAICELSDRQVKDFFSKLIPDERQRLDAIHDYFWNPATAFLQNLKNPFYLKCYVEFVKSGERELISKTDMMNKLLDKMIQREIEQKGFRATLQLVKDFLVKLAELISEGRAIPEQTALKELRGRLIYDTEQYASVVQIKDTLVELQILREAANGNQPVMLMFYHENYRSIYSPAARNVSRWGKRSKG